MILMLLFVLYTATPMFVSNLTLVGLMETLEKVLPPQPAQVLGIDKRNQWEGLDSKRVLRIENWRLQGKILALTGHLEVAETIFSENHEEQCPRDAFWLALIYAQQERLEEMFGYLRKMPESSMYFGQAGFVEWQLGHYDRSIRLLTMSESLADGCVVFPNPSYVYQILSKEAYHNLGDWVLALHWAKCWADVRPEDIDAYIQLAGLYIAREQFERGYEALERGRIYGIKEHRLYPLHLGKIYQSRGEWSSAIEFYREAWNRNQNHEEMIPYVAWYLGHALFKGGQLIEAERYLEIVEGTGHSALRQRAKNLLEEIESRER